MTNCRSCKGKLKDILSLGDQYLSDFIDETDPKPEKYPLNLSKCEKCSLVQLKETTPASSLYNSHYGYYSGISNTIRDDLKDIAQKAFSKVNLFEGDIVLDIGSNDATFLKYFPDSLMRVGVDPVSKFAKFYSDRNLYFINEFFNERTATQIDRLLTPKPKIITCTSMFYDIDDPNDFVRGLRRLLNPEGILVIQQNYLAGMLRQNAFCNIVHEHLEYYSLYSLERLLSRHYFEVVDVEENDINGGSFRVYVKHMSPLRKMRLKEKEAGLLSDNIYFIFAMKVRQAARELHNFIKSETDRGKTVFVYGASTRGNTLLQTAKLDNKMISYAVERNPVKFGKKIASLDIPIISEEKARKMRPDYFLVCPWFFKEEIVKREDEFIKQGGALIFPLPELEIVNYDTLNKKT